jgi:hypothetical protein
MRTNWQTLHRLLWMNIGCEVLDPLDGARVWEGQAVGLVYSEVQDEC